MGKRPTSGIFGTGKKLCAKLIYSSMPAGSPADLSAEGSSAFKNVLKIEYRISNKE